MYLRPFPSARKGGVGPVPENSPAGPVNALKELKKLEKIAWTSGVFFCSLQEDKKLAINKTPA